MMGRNEIQNARFVSVFFVIVEIDTLWDCYYIKTTYEYSRVDYTYVITHEYE